MKTVLLFATFIIVIFSGCQKDQSAITEPVVAPNYTVDPNLSVAEILQRQNIRSLHFLQWDSVRVNGELLYPFMPSWEIYIDARRLSMTKYEQYRCRDELIVMNLDEGEAFQYSYAQRKFLDLIGERDNLEVFEDIAKLHLLSQLPRDSKFIDEVYFENHFCRVIGDSAERREWIWLKHRLPVKREAIFIHDSTHVISNREYRDIHINKGFPYTLFVRP